MMKGKDVIGASAFTAEQVNAFEIMQENFRENMDGAKARAKELRAQGFNVALKKTHSPFTGAVFHFLGAVRPRRTEE